VIFPIALQGIPPTTIVQIVKLRFPLFCFFAIVRVKASTIERDRVISTGLMHTPINHRRLSTKHKIAVHNRVTTRRESEEGKKNGFRENWCRSCSLTRRNGRDRHYLKARNTSRLCKKPKIYILFIISTIICFLHKSRNAIVFCIYI